MQASPLCTESALNRLAPHGVGLYDVGFQKKGLATQYPDGLGVNVGAMDPGVHKAGMNGMPHSPQGSYGPPHRLCA